MEVKEMIQLLMLLFVLIYLVQWDVDYKLVKTHRKLKKVKIKIDYNFLFKLLKCFIQN